MPFSAFSWTIVTLLLLLNIAGKGSYAVNLEKVCKPKLPKDSTIYLSSQKAFGVVYDVTEESKSSNDGAAIFCTIEGKTEEKKFAKTELIIYAEPPHAVNLELPTQVISALHDTTVFCLVSEIKSINRMTPVQESDKKVDVTYECDDETSSVKIVLQGLRTLNEEDTSDIYLWRDANSEIEKQQYDVSCVNQTDCDKRKHTNLGDSCIDRSPKRWMFNESDCSSTSFVCAQCCAGHYWDVNSDRCEKCGPCSTREGPNVWTSCFPLPGECITSTTPTMSSTTEATKRPRIGDVQNTPVSSTTEATKKPKIGDGDVPNPTVTTAMPLIIEPTTEKLEGATSTATVIAESNENNPGALIVGIVAAVVVIIVIVGVIYCRRWKSRQPEINYHSGQRQTSV